MGCLPASTVATSLYRPRRRLRGFRMPSSSALRALPSSCQSTESNLSKLSDCQECGLSFLEQTWCCSGTTSGCSSAPAGFTTAVWCESSGSGLEGPGLKLTLRVGGEGAAAGSSAGSSGGESGWVSSSATSACNPCMAGRTLRYPTNLGNQCNMNEDDLRQLQDERYAGINSAIMKD